MPPMAQQHFPRQGHLLYESDEEVAPVTVREAYFDGDQISILSV